MGWRDMRIRYATTILGPFWTTLSVLLTTMALGVVYGTLFNLELKTYIPYVSTGLLVWNFFSNVLNEAPFLLPPAKSLEILQYWISKTF
jgi:ABC-2 type transport system permease protein